MKLNFRASSLHLFLTHAYFCSLLGFVCLSTFLIASPRHRSHLMLGSLFLFILIACWVRLTVPLIQTKTSTPLHHTMLAIVDHRPISLASPQSCGVGKKSTARTVGFAAIRAT